MRNIDELKTIFVDRFKDLLKEKCVTTIDVSKAIGFPNSTINAWKLGKTTIQIDGLNALADYFKVSVDYLLGREQ